MATNPPKGDNHRNGAVRDRSQVHNPRNDRWVKRDGDTVVSWTKRQTRNRSKASERKNSWDCQEHKRCLKNFLEIYEGWKVA